MTATVTRQADHMTTQEPFDPLVDLDGLWTVGLAAKYLPIPGMPLAKYECWDGRLYMAPYESLRNSFGEMKLGQLLAGGAEEAGYSVCGQANLVLGTPDRWIQPDVTIVSGSLEETWLTPANCVLPIEFVSPESKRRDRIGKPERLAKVGVPWYMTVELEPKQKLATVVLFKLIDGAYEPVVVAASGQRFEMEEPFTASFDPAELLR